MEVPHAPLLGSVADTGSDGPDEASRDGTPAGAAPPPPFFPGVPFVPFAAAGSGNGNGAAAEEWVPLHLDRTFVPPPAPAVAPGPAGFLPLPPPDYSTSPVPAFSSPSLPPLGATSRRRLVRW